HDTIHAVFDRLDPNGKKIMTDDRTMSFQADRDLRNIDFDVVLTAAERVVFGDDKDGAFAVRMADALSEEKGSGVIVNAQGQHTEANTWGKPSEWVDYSGKIGSEAMGIAIFDHPKNPGHPNRWHVRAYGLFACNPYARHAFDKNLPEARVTINPGEPLHF